MYANRDSMFTKKIIKLANDFAVTVKKQNHNTLYYILVNNNMLLIASPNFHPLCDFNHRRCCLMSLFAARVEC